MEACLGSLTSSIINCPLRTHHSFAPIHGFWKRVYGTKVKATSELQEAVHVDHKESLVLWNTCESHGSWEEENGSDDCVGIGKTLHPNFPEGAFSNRQLFYTESSSSHSHHKEDPRGLLKKRRKCAREALIEALQDAKFGAAYSKDLANCMEEFIDRVVIKAVALKKNPEFAATLFEFRAKAYIKQIGLTSIIRWLKHNGLTIPRIGELTFLVEDYASVLKPKITWLKSIHVKGRDLGVVLTQETRILEKSVQELESTVEFLEIHGLKRDWIGLVVKRCPKVLSLGNMELHKRVIFFSKLGITDDKFGTMIFNFPASLVHFAVEEMQNKVDYLKGFGLESLLLGRTIASEPELLAGNIEDGWKPLVRYLYCLGIEKYGIRRILIVRPSVFCLSLDAIVEKIQFLRAIGVHEGEIGDVIVKFPPLLTYSLDMKIRPVVRFLLETAGVSEKDVGKVMAAHPEIIRCSLPNKLVALVKYFLSCGFHRHELGRMLADFPMLIKYSLPVLKPKLRFFKTRMRRQLNEIIRFPRYFSYSLQSRIAPRFKILQEKELYFSLEYMLACSDAQFINRVEALSSNAQVLNLAEDTCHNKQEDQEVESVKSHSL